MSLHNKMANESVHGSMQAKIIAHSRMVVGVSRQRILGKATIVCAIAGFCNKSYKDSIHSIHQRTGQ